MQGSGRASRRRVGAVELAVIRRALGAPQPRDPSVEGQLLVNCCWGSTAVSGEMPTLLTVVASHIGRSLPPRCALVVLLGALGPFTGHKHFLWAMGALPLALLPVLLALHAGDDKVERASAVLHQPQAGD